MQKLFSFVFIFMVLTVFLHPHDFIDESIDLSKDLKIFSSNIIDVNLESNLLKGMKNIALPEVFKNLEKKSYTYISKKFTLNEKFKNKRAFLELKGIKGRFFIFLNGENIANDESFTDYYLVDITDFCLLNEENKLLIIFDFFNSKSPVFCLEDISIKTKNSVSHRININKAEKPISIVLLESNARKKRALVEITTKLINDTTDDKKIRLISNLKNKKSGKQVNLIDREVTIKAKSIYEHKERRELSGIDFWSFESPYLYEYISTLKSGEELLDTEKLIVGFRDIEYIYDDVRAKYGLYINGKIFFLRGFNYSLSRDWQIADFKKEWMIEESILLIKESGANFINIDDSFLNDTLVKLCDELGIVIGVTVNSENNFKELAVRYANNPSISFVNLIFDLTEERIKTLKEFAKGVGFRAFLGTMNPNIDIAKELDWVGTRSFRFLLDDIEKYKAVIEINSIEYDIVKKGKLDNQNSIDESTFIRMLSHIFKLFYERSCVNRDAKKRIWSGIVINDFSDYKNEMFFAKGIVTALREKKGIYFAYKAIFGDYSKIDSLYIFDVRGSDDKNSFELFAVSNSDYLALYVDNKLSKTNKTAINKYIFKFENVPFAYQNIQLVGYKKYKKVCYDTLALSEDAVKLKIDYKIMPEVSKGFDYYLVEVRAIDKNNRADVRYNKTVDLAIEGEAEIYLDDLSYFTTDDTIKANLINGITRIIVKKVADGKRVKIRVFSENIEQDEIFLNKDF